MGLINSVITGIGIIAPGAIGKEDFWKMQEEGKNAISEITSFPVSRFSVRTGAEVKNFDAKSLLGHKGLRNLDKSTLFLLAASKQALESANLEITDKNTDDIGICTGTTFSHLWPIVEFDREVFNEGLSLANPALFPSTVVNAASSHVSIRFNIQGFNTTISTGYTSGLEALRYAIRALESRKSRIALSGAVDTLTESLFSGFRKLGYLAGITGEALSCPFDKRRNGPLFGEGAVVFSVEDLRGAEERNANIFAKIRSISSSFDGFRVNKIHPRGEGLEKAIRQALERAAVSLGEVDYISSCANSSQELDRIEVKVLKNIFGRQLEKIPVSSIKSMIGETFSTGGNFQIASCIGAMLRGIVPPTINYRQIDEECRINCVPNKAEKKDVRIALVVCFGPGGYNSACILERYLKQ
ncbi:beta-ketoacyl-[acyl-carrier-protein] synthase family protein [Candidatus Omnitrophota bacterium]